MSREDPPLTLRVRGRRAGVRASNAQDYAAAREHFMRSRQLVPKASTLMNLAITDLKLGLTRR